MSLSRQAVVAMLKNVFVKLDYLCNKNVILLSCERNKHAGTAADPDHDARQGAVSWRQSSYRGFA